MSEKERQNILGTVEEMGEAAPAALSELASFAAGLKAGWQLAQQAAATTEATDAAAAAFRQAAYEAGAAAGTISALRHSAAEAAGMEVQA